MESKLSKNLLKQLLHFAHLISENLDFGVPRGILLMCSNVCPCLAKTSLCRTKPWAL